MVVQPVCPYREENKHPLYYSLFKLSTLGVEGSFCILPLCHFNLRAFQRDVNYARYRADVGYAYPSITTVKAL